MYTLTGADQVGNANSLTITVSVPIAVTSLTLANGAATAGKPEPGDTIAIQFNGPISVNSACSAWANNTADQLLTDAIVTILDGGGAHDSIAFSSPSCVLHLGTIDLGSTGYAPSGQVTFGATGSGSTIAYSASTYKITITLGTQQSSTLLSTIAASVATLHPSSGLLGVGGNSIPPHSPPRRRGSSELAGRLPVLAHR